MKKSMPKASSSKAKSRTPKPKSKAKSTSNGNGSIPMRVDNKVSLGVREIENGFIVSESGSTGKGRNQEYYSKEYFSKANPIRLGAKK